MDDKRLDILRDENGKLPFNDDQKKAILEGGKILVSASAGSGKTYTMVQRIILMISEGAKIKDMLILVYNNSAADELKEKMHKALFDHACKSTGAMREKFASALDDLPFCHVSTIHAYCQSLIRENFNKIGISPTFEVLDENAHNLYMNKALDKVFEDYENKGDDEFDEIMAMFSQSRKDKELRKKIIRLFNLMEIHPTRDEFVECVNESYDSFEASTLYKIFVQHTKAIASRALIDFKKLFEELGDREIGNHKINLIGAQLACERILNANSIEEMCNAKFEYESNKQTFNSPKKYGEWAIEFGEKAKAYINQYMAAFDDLLKIRGKDEYLKQYHKQNGKYVKKLVEIVEAFANELQGLKAIDNVLSFEDLQHKAMQLLASDESGEFKKFESVFVDEYQDVNPLQEAIIKSLIKDECFMVGDVKQSIYGFRLADPMIFISRQNDYQNIKGLGTNILFNENFRSESAILKFVNDIFDSAMTRESADVDYKGNAQFVIKGEEIYANKYVQLHLFEEPPQPKKQAQSGLYDITLHDQEQDNTASMREGKFIASEIKSIVGKAIGTDDDGNGIYHSYGDIAILFRSRSKEAFEILRVLREEGIPLNDSGFSTSNNAPEREIISLLRVIDNPRQDIPLAGYMLSFIGGYDESEMAEIARLKGDSLYDKIIAYAKDNVEESKNPNDRQTDLREKLNITLNALKRYRIKASSQNIADLMSDIVQDYSFDAYLMSQGEAEVYNLKAFISSARNLEMSLGEFLDNYDANDKKDQGAGSSGGDSVTISTFHGYKGLEKAFVFVSDIANSFNLKATQGNLIMSGKGIGIDQTKQNFKGLVGMYAFDFDEKVYCKNTISHFAVARCIKENQIKEEIRLFYVALTRARKQMYLTASLSKTKLRDFGQTPTLLGAKCCLDFISNAIYDGYTSIMPIKHYPDDVDATIKEGRIVFPKANSTLLEKIDEVMNTPYEYDSATKLAMKYSVSQIDSLGDNMVRVYKEAANVGTAYHKVMQNIDYFVEGEEGVKQEIERMLVENVLTKDESSVINVGEIRRCLDSDIIQKARNSEKLGKCYREHPFMMYVKANEVIEGADCTDKVLVQGVIDLFIDGEERYIVDFKNSTLRDEETLKKYKKQLYLYKKAVESSFSVKIDKVMLYSFKTGKTTEM